MLSVAELIAQLQEVPADSAVEVWYPVGRGAFGVDVDVKLQEVNDDGRRTGHRHPMCGTHAGPAWNGDPNTAVTAVYGAADGRPPAP